MRRIRRIWIWVMVVATMITAMPEAVFALINTNDNNYLVVGTTPSGKVGKSMSISVTLRNASGKTQSKMGVGLDEDVYFDDEGAVVEDRNSYIFPFEITKSTFEASFTKSKMETEEERKLSITVKVRKDITAGYYSVRMAIYDENKSVIDYEYLNIWISSTTGTTEDDEDAQAADFILGEGQSTPGGVYPAIMDYSLNLRNNSPAAVYNVKVSMELNRDKTIFPFEINDVNYDRYFDKLDVNQLVELSYSMAIRPNTYSNYYAIKLIITYSENSTGSSLKTFETSYYVKIENKEEEDEKGDFNQNDRTKARVIVDGFVTEPKDIIAGESFELICQIKNASKNISATNLLLSLESEKISDSAVFTTESGASAIYMDDLAPGQSRELRLHLLSKPGIEQRSYSLKISAKFDSPEYKNAEEVLSIDIPVKQIARVNTSSFEIMPTDISVGDETNIMFGINNTGKIILYNVMVNFKADSIQPMEVYVGNIKPGDTGNVDCMLTGIAATADEGKIKVIVSYEDENGEVSDVSKEMQLYVSEPVSDWDDMEIGNFDDIQMAETSFFQKYKTWIICGGAAAVLVLVITIGVVRRNRKKKRAMDEDMDDEIS